MRKPSVGSKPKAGKARPKRGGKGHAADKDAPKDLFEGIPRHVVKLWSLQNEWWHASKFRGEPEAYHLMLAARHTAWAVTRPEARELADSYLEGAGAAAGLFLRKLGEIYNPGSGRNLGGCCIPQDEHRAGPFMLTPNAGSRRSWWLETIESTIAFHRRNGCTWGEIGEAIAGLLASPWSPLWPALPEPIRADFRTPGADEIRAKGRAAAERIEARLNQHEAADPEKLIVAIARALDYPKPEHLFDAKAAAETRAAQKS